MSDLTHNLIITFLALAWAVQYHETQNMCVCVLGSAGGRGEADGARERTSAEIWRAADGERVAAQQCSEILNTTFKHSLRC